MAQGCGGLPSGERGDDRCEILEPITRHRDVVDARRFTTLLEQLDDDAAPYR